MPPSLMATAAIAIPRQAVRANCCDAWWTGLSTAHCSACHQTFTTVGAFDKHRTGKHADDTRHCLPPDSVGLVDAGRSYLCWAHPGSWRTPRQAK